MWVLKITLITLGGERVKVERRPRTHVGITERVQGNKGDGATTLEMKKEKSDEEKRMCQSSRASPAQSLLQTALFALAGLCFHQPG